MEAAFVSEDSNNKEKRLTNESFPLGYAWHLYMYSRTMILEISFLKLE